MADDAGNSGGSNYAPTISALVTRVASTVQTLNPKGTEWAGSHRPGDGVGLRC